MPKKPPKKKRESQSRRRSSASKSGEILSLVRQPGEGNPLARPQRMWPRIRGKLAHTSYGFAFVFRALRGTGCASLGADAANAVSELGASREQSHASPAQFKAFATEPNGFPRHGRILCQGFLAALRAPA